MARPAADHPPLKELLLQALETETAGIQVYQLALACARNAELRAEWAEFLEQTENHQRVLLALFAELGLDPQQRTPGRDAVGHIGQALVKAMQVAEATADAVSAELVACNCVLLAETRDHANWVLIGHAAARLGGPWSQALRRAFDAVHLDEDRHLLHNQGWCRELWLSALGFPAVLPPPEELQRRLAEDGGTRTSAGSNYGDYAPDPRGTPYRDPSRGAELERDVLPPQADFSRPPALARKPP